MSATLIRAVHVEPLNIPLLAPLTTTSGKINNVENILITITLQDGTHGYGECSPFPASTGESQATALAAAQSCSGLLLGKDAAHWRNLSKLIRTLHYAHRTVCAGIEIALLDALTRSYDMPLSIFFGGASTSLATDMSIPMVSAEQSFMMAEAAMKRGINTLKIRIGGDLRDDVNRVEAARSGAPHLGIILDASQGYTANETLLCLEALEDRDIRPLLIEQPVHKDDIVGLRHVMRHTTVPVAADESADSAAAVIHLIREEAINVVNIQLMKTGIVEALDIAAICRSNHIQLMIGANMESRLAVSAAAHFATGLGGFLFADLDSPMLMAEDPFTGGYKQQGGIYDISDVDCGLGIQKVSS